MLEVKGDGATRNGMRFNPPPVETQARVTAFAWCLHDLGMNLHRGRNCVQRSLPCVVTEDVGLPAKPLLQKRIGADGGLGESP